MNNVQLAVASSIGNARENQEDNFLTPHYHLTPELRGQMEQSRRTLVLADGAEGGRFLFAVSDGMGGHAAGEVASLETVRWLAANAGRLTEAAMLGEGAIVQQITLLNQDVVAAGRRESRYLTMGATLCGVVADHGSVYGFNAGDSRMYQYSGGRLKQLSTDHTEGQRLLSLGLLTPDEVAKLPRRKSIYKYIGMPRGDLIADVFPISGLFPGTILLLCSDGLSDVLRPEEMAAVLAMQARLPEKANLLVEQAIERKPGAGDNITAVLAEF